MIEVHGKLSFCRKDSITFGCFGTTFCGTFEGLTKVAIKHILKKEFTVDIEVLHLAQSHPNILCYFCNEQDIEYM